MQRSLESAEISHAKVTQVGATTTAAERVRETVHAANRDGWREDAVKSRSNSCKLPSLAAVSPCPHLCLAQSLSPHLPTPWSTAPALLLLSWAFSFVLS